MKLELLHALVYHIGLNGIVLLLNSLFDILNEEIISVLKWKLTLIQEWKHTPVDQVGTISLGCVLVGNIGEATQYLLAGSSLLSGRTITRLDSKDRRTDLCLLRRYLKGTVDGVKYLFYLRECCKDILSCDTGLLSRLNLFGASYIGRILTGKCKLCQTQRVGTEGGCLAGWDQLVCGGNRIVNLGYDL